MKPTVKIFEAIVNKQNSKLIELISEELYTKSMILIEENKPIIAKKIFK